LWLLTIIHNIDHQVDIKTSYDCFFVERGVLSREMTALAWANTHSRIKVRNGVLGDPIPVNALPVGSVEFVEQFIGIQQPNYFPDWLYAWCPTIKVLKNFDPPSKADNVVVGMFVKPADRYKRFDGHIAQTGEVLSGLCQFTPQVKFVNEWRYYVIDGCIVDSGWYSGVGDWLEAPTLSVGIPDDWCGTIDMGETDRGNLLVVECHPPYAIGWYGTKHEKYVQLLERGYRRLRLSYLEKKLKADLAQKNAPHEIQNLAPPV
jgi:hypothetical protein